MKRWLYLRTRHVLYKFSSNDHIKRFINKRKAISESADSFLVDGFVHTFSPLWNAVEPSKREFRKNALQFAPSPSSSASHIKDTLGPGRKMLGELAIALDRERVGL